jgi:hypothetical protein
LRVGIRDVRQSCPARVPMRVATTAADGVTGQR